ncbi:Acylphosphatase [Nannocystis exedens]|uniref:acylphosphatase n=1 Tax=Nannocystis exedens TaxID=54 RepID=A0A1I2FH66_9BACT|nr:Acylphosphatase [Nannocystis exedens]SFF04229.1 Acylphosphatase [Nannocystis exedens]
MAITVTGVVQGVGFRPFVHRLASGLGLGGFVRNRIGDVLIEVEGGAGTARTLPRRARARRAGGGCDPGCGMG